MGLNLKPTCSHMHALCAGRQLTYVIIAQTRKFSTEIRRGETGGETARQRLPNVCYVLLPFYAALRRSPRRRR